MNRLQLKVYPYIGQFKKLKWFTNVGQPLDVDPAISVVRVETWRAAVSSMMSETSERVMNQIHSRSRDALMENQTEEWNRDIYAPFGNWLDVLVSDVIDYMARTTHPCVGTNWYLRRDIRACLTFRALEIAFLPPAFESPYAVMWDLLLSGHMPCGWKGKWPAGSLVVY